MNTGNVVPHLREEAVNTVGDLLEGGVTTGIKITLLPGEVWLARQVTLVTYLVIDS